jgi:hypothetical protein
LSSRPGAGHDETPRASFKPVAASGIDVDMLKQQQEILLYDEIVLFQVR